MRVMSIGAAMESDELLRQSLCAFHVQHRAVPLTTTFFVPALPHGKQPHGHLYPLKCIRDPHSTLSMCMLLSMWKIRPTLKMDTADGAPGDDIPNEMRVAFKHKKR